LSAFNFQSQLAFGHSPFCPSRAGAERAESFLFFKAFGFADCKSLRLSINRFTIDRTDTQKLIDLQRSQLFEFASGNLQLAPRLDPLASSAHFVVNCKPQLQASDVRHHVPCQRRVAGLRVRIRIIRSAGAASLWRVTLTPLAALGT